MTANCSLQLEVITSYEELLGLRSEWSALEVKAGAELPFQTWEWAVAWWQHLREDRLGVRDSLRVVAIRDASSALVAIAPLILTERPAHGPLRVRYLQFLGADPNITEIRTMLCLPGFEQQVCEALRAHFAAQPGDWDWIACEGAGTPADNDHRVQVHKREDKSAFVLDLGSDWASMKTGLARNIKESLRKCYNSLRRDGLSASLETIDEPAVIQDALTDFFRLHAQRATFKNAPRHADVFASHEAQAFLTDVCSRLAERGVARIFRLRVGGQIVAIRIGFQMGDTLYLYYSGWETAYGRYSVMTTLLAEVIQQAIADGVATINLSTGTDVSKTRWRPREVVYSSHIEVSPAASARMRYVSYQAMRAVGTGRAARELLPGFLVRRSEPKTNLPKLKLPGLRAHSAVRLHGLAAAATAIVALDLLDNRLDHKLTLLPRILEHFLN